MHGRWTLHRHFCCCPRHSCLLVLCRQSHWIGAGSLHMPSMLLLVGRRCQACIDSSQNGHSRFTQPACATFAAGFATDSSTFHLTQVAGIKHSHTLWSLLTGYISHGTVTTTGTGNGCIACQQVQLTRRVLPLVGIQNTALCDPCALNLWQLFLVDRPCHIRGITAQHGALCRKQTAQQHHTRLGIMTREQQVDTQVSRK